MLDVDCISDDSVARHLYDLCMFQTELPDTKGLVQSLDRICHVVHVYRFFSPIALYYRLQPLPNCLSLNVAWSDGLAPVGLLLCCIDVFSYVIVDGTDMSFLCTILFHCLFSQVLVIYYLYKNDQWNIFSLKLYINCLLSFFCIFLLQILFDDVI